MRRVLTNILTAVIRRIRSRSRTSQERGLTAVEYEAVTLIAYEGQGAYDRAREQAQYCRKKGSGSGVLFWTQVADEVRLRTRGRVPEK